MTKEIQSLCLSNLTGIHKLEESIRTQSLELIAASELLNDYFIVSAISMDIVHTLSIAHANQTSEELIIQKLGLRLFNNAATSTKLLLSGYYQRALDIVRDTIELAFLLDYLSSSKELITAWGTSTTDERKFQFSPMKVRMYLDNRDGLKQGKRHKTYKTFSEYASHASHQGFRLLVADDTNLHTIGPFLSPFKLEMVIHELATYHSYAALVFMQHFDDLDITIVNVVDGYITYLKKWSAKYNISLGYNDD